MLCVFLRSIQLTCVSARVQAACVPRKGFCRCICSDRQSRRKDAARQVQKIPPPWLLARTQYTMLGCCKRVMRQLTGRSVCGWNSNGAPQSLSLSLGFAVEGSISEQTRGTDFYFIQKQDLHLLKPLCQSRSWSKTLLGRRSGLPHPWQRPCRHLSL